MADGTESEPAIEKPGQRLLVDLWPFAFSREYYEALFSAFTGSGGMPSHVLIISTIAHPASLLALHDLRCKGHLLLDRVERHSATHGDDSLRACWTTSLSRRRRSCQREATNVCSPPTFARSMWRPRWSSR